MIFKKCLFGCISKCDEPVVVTDNNSITAPLNIICCKSQLIEKHGSDNGTEKSLGEDILQSNAGSQFFECTEFPETFAIPEISD